MPNKKTLDVVKVPVLIDRVGAGRTCKFKFGRGNAGWTLVSVERQHLREWFEVKPTGVFMSELDQQRMYWEQGNETAFSPNR